MTEQPGLFDLPPPPTPPSAPRSGRGHTRETWPRTVTAVDRRALRDEALRRLEDGIVIGEFADDDPDLTDPREDVAQSCAAAVQWCLEPTEGLWPLLEAGAVRIDQVELAATDEEPGRVRASWTVTVRITDAHAARELARTVCPAGDDAARAEIDAGFAAAWNRAADPHAPMHRIPGIRWTPDDVDVTHLVRRRPIQDAE
ncbi:MAG: hypothetical protein L0H64_00650 [Pseudonocardia sp.]|nr:hypothetical protein [Pseudonocardia sp.]